MAFTTIELCEATGCRNPATHHAIVTWEVPAWRRPDSAKPDEKCYECGPRVGVCDEHRQLLESKEVVCT